MNEESMIIATLVKVVLGETWVNNLYVFWNNLNGIISKIIYKSDIVEDILFEE